MKILHVCEYVRGGITTYMNEILRYQVSSGQTESVHLLMSRFNSDKISVNGVHVHYYKYKRKLSEFLPAALRIQKQIRQIRPDIIHVHSSFAGLLVRICYLYKKERPRIVYCAHGWSFLMEVSPLKKALYGVLEKVLSSKTDLIIDISTKEYLGAQKYRIPDDKSLVIPNGIDERTNLVRPVTVSMVHDPSKITLLFVGRFDRQKGFDLLVDFFKSHPLRNTILYAVGENVLDPAMKEEMPDNIVSLGWVDHSTIDFYYQQADAVIIPSRWEGFGLVAVEAMKNKKPVLASNRGDLPELVKNGINGYLFDLDHLDDLTRILTTVTKPELKAMGEHGFIFFKNHFTSKKLNQRLMKVYEQLTEKREPIAAHKPVTQYEAK